MTTATMPQSFIGSVTSTTEVTLVDYSKASDFELAQLAGKKGDMAAFEKLYNRHHRRVYSICLRMLQNSSSAEDLTQDVFIQLYRKAHTFKGNSAFTTWLHRLTTNQVLMYFRKNSTKNEKVTEPGEIPDRAVPGTLNPLRMSIDHCMSIEKAINQLPDGYKNVFVLHDVEGFEHAEVARILGCSIGTSKSQLHKARLKLQKLINRKVNPRG